ncbi:fimbrial protein [Scandinavium manionii]|uniref:fimbrial protein n=1 Tax=Scandinavium manionii TaxID=2926520 RepID=UPI00135AEF01|nr:fimbrial protein [Scandinavium manionii]MCS2149605.1 type 1 fimbrial protein [Scandinavium manionii]MCS2168714.1 type 1 fimbrial protein [Scandinavium manionii]
MKKIVVFSFALSAAFSLTAAQASDGQMQINGQVFNTSCTIAIDGSPTANKTIVLDGIPVTALSKSVNTVSGSALMASDTMKTVTISLKDCTLPQDKTTVGVSFDTNGYGDSRYSSYRNMLLDSINTQSTAAKGVNIGFTAPGAETELVMGEDKAIFKAPDTNNEVAYDYQIRYVTTGADTTGVTAGDLDTVATFSVVYE